MTLFTIGVYGTTPGAFFDELSKNGVDVLIDIRRRRAVRGSQYTFANAQRLTDELAAREIAYLHVLGLAPDLETLNLQGRADTEAKRLKSERTELSAQYLEQYTARTLNTFDFAALARELKPYKAPVLFCVERIAQACHRSLVAPKLATALGAREVDHLMPAGAGFEVMRVLRETRRKRAALKRRYG